MQTWMKMVNDNARNRKLVKLKNLLFRLNQARPCWCLWRNSSYAFWPMQHVPLPWVLLGTSRHRSTRSCHRVFFEIVLFIWKKLTFIFFFFAVQEPISRSNLHFKFLLIEQLALIINKQLVPFTIRIDGNVFGIGFVYQFIGCFAWYPSRIKLSVMLSWTQWYHILNE